MGTYRGRKYYIVSTKQYLLREYKDEIKKKKYVIVKLPKNNSDVKMGKGNYALLPTMRK